MESNVRACAFDTRFTHRPQRPLLRSQGGKCRNAERIVRHFPSHHIYVEPFGGGASVLLKKPRSFAEVYNDLDQDIVNLFRVMREPAKAAQLIEQVRWTPFARDEFCLAYEDVEDPIERARRTVVRAFMGYEDRTGLVTHSDRRRKGRAQDWRGVRETLLPIADRLRGVMIENRDPYRVIAEHDSEETLFYIDGDDLPTVQSSGRRRPHRRDAFGLEHAALTTTLARVQGYVVISGFDSKLDGDLFAEWTRIEWRDHTLRGRARSEMLWLSPNIREAEVFAHACGAVS